MHCEGSVMIGEVKVGDLVKRRAEIADHEFEQVSIVCLVMGLNTTADLVEVEHLFLEGDPHDINLLLRLIAVSNAVSNGATRMPSEETLISYYNSEVAQKRIIHKSQITEVLS